MMGKESNFVNNLRCLLLNEQISLFIQGKSGYKGEKVVSIFYYHTSRVCHNTVHTLQNQMCVHKGYIVPEKCFERVHADQIGALVSTEPLLSEISQKIHKVCFQKKWSSDRGESSVHNSKNLMTC